MRPWERNCTASLSKEDVKQIQALYGNKETSIPRDDPNVSRNVTSSMTKLTSISTSTPPTMECGAVIDAMVVTTSGRIFGFYGCSIVMFTSTAVAPSYPRKIDELFTRGPRRVDAAFSIYQGWGSHSQSKIYLIEGIDVWRYTEDLRLGRFHLDSGYPHTLLQEFNIDALTVDAAYADNKRKIVYIFKGEYFWSLKMRVSRHHIRFLTGRVSEKRKSKLFNRMPRFDAALSTQDALYFFQADDYFRYTNHGGRPELVGPRDTRYWWFGCQRQH